VEKSGWPVHGHNAQAVVEIARNFCPRSMIRCNRSSPRSALSRALMIAESVMSNRLLASAYAYTVCFASLALFAYALLTLAPSPAQVNAQLAPVYVSVMNTDTTDTTGTTGTASADADALAAFDCALAPEQLKTELRDLHASQKSFAAARAELENARLALRQAGFRVRLIQRGLIVLFAASAFTFHWRWIRGQNNTAA